MFAEFKHALGRFNGRIWGWGIGLACYSLILAYFFEMFIKSSQLATLLASYPQDLLAFFGEMMEAAKPVGYIDTYYYLYMTVILGIFAVGAGAAMLVQDEEHGILDLVLAHPVSRTALFCGRWLAFAVATVAILLLGWAGWLPLAQRVGLDLTPWQFWVPNVPLLAQMLLFFSLSLVLSVILPSSRMAGSLAGALLAANWLLRGLAAMNQKLERVMKWTPLHFYQGGKAAAEGLNVGWLLVVLAATLLLTAVAWVLFQRRDIRVSGERSWTLPAWASKLRRRP